MGAQILGVSVAAPHQAQALMDGSLDYQLLLDPDGQFKAGALGVRELRRVSYLSPRVWWRYLRSSRNARPGRVTAALTEPPAVVVLGRHNTLEFLHAGGTSGDYPPVETVLEVVSRLVARS